MVTLSDSHGTAGAAAAVSRLGSALAIAMMVGGSGTRGRPPWPRALVQTGCALRDGHRLIRMRATFPVAVRGACAEAVSYRTHPECLRAVRQLTKVGRGRVKRHHLPQLRCGLTLSGRYLE